MRARVLLVAALALSVSPVLAAADATSRMHTYQMAPLESPPPLRLDHIKRQILAKLGLSSRPVPLRAPPRDVVRQILSRASDATPETKHDEEHSEREIIAIAHRALVYIGYMPSFS